MKKTKILILNLPGLILKSGSRWPVKVSSQKTRLRYFPYPWSMGYATSFLKKNKLTVAFKDAVALEWTQEQTRTFIKDYDPNYILCETTSLSIEEDAVFLGSLDKKIVKIAVGQFSTVEPNLCVKLGFDYAVVGEYELSIKDFFQNTEKLPVNFVSKNKKSYCRYPLLENLDILPFPERDDTPMKFFNEPSCFGKNIVMVSSRGCRFDCNYCIINGFYGKRRVRVRDSGKVVDEMEYLKKNYDFDEIYFDDDNITAKAGHLENICHEIINRGLKIKWVCMGDAFINLKTIKLLSLAGCCLYKFGVEHFDKEVLALISKPVTYEKVWELVKECKKNNIKTHLNMMIGLPRSTFTKDLDMVKKVIKINPTAAQFAVATAYRGTKFYSEALQKGWFDKKNPGDCHISQPMVSYPNYNSSEIGEMHKLALNMWRKHLITTQPASCWFYFSGNTRREGFFKTLAKSFAYLKKIF